MCSYCRKHDETEVPDPYYGGQQGFEKVIQKCLNMFVLDMKYGLKTKWEVVSLIGILEFYML